ncbi:phage head-binding domain-containing protein [Escherichia coli]|uniref:phage head-binding domain-containing protein n=1 Tax=Escherichia coli TaxID=562 RepID=UPI0033611A78
MTDITANVIVSMPSQLFTMARSFKAVANGEIYIGKIDTDPVNPENRIQVYVENEDGSHVPVSQPIIINAAGYPVYNGQIAKFVTVQGHSMAVYDAYGAKQFYFPNVLKYDPDQLKLNFYEMGYAIFFNGVDNEEKLRNAIIYCNEKGIAVNCSGLGDISITGTEDIVVKTSVDFAGLTVDVSGWSGKFVIQDDNGYQIFPSSSPLVQSLVAQGIQSGAKLKGWESITDADDSYIRIMTNQPFFTYRGSVVNREEYNKHSRFGLLSSVLKYDLDPTKITEIRVLKVAKKWKTFGNVSFHIGNRDITGQPEVVHVQYASLTVLKDIRFTLDNITYQNGNPVLISLWDSCHLKLENVYCQWPMYSEYGGSASYTYDININLCYDVTLDNCDGIGDGWGATGNNSSQLVRIKNSKLSRIDFHQPFRELLKITDTKIGDGGITITALGDLVIDGSCEFLRSDRKTSLAGAYIIARSDTNGFCDGKLIIRGAKFTFDSETPKYLLRQFGDINQPKPDGSPINYVFFDTIEIDGIQNNYSGTLSLAPVVQSGIGVSYPATLLIKNCVDGNFEFKANLNSQTPFGGKSNDSIRNTAARSNFNFVMDNVKLLYTSRFELVDTTANNFRINLSMNRVYGTKGGKGISMLMNFAGVISAHNCEIESFDSLTGGGLTKYLDAIITNSELRFQARFSTYIINGFAQGKSNIKIANSLVDIPTTADAQTTSLIQCRLIGNSYVTAGNQSDMLKLQSTGQTVTVGPSANPSNSYVLEMNGNNKWAPFILPKEIDEISYIQQSDSSHAGVTKNTETTVFMYGSSVAPLAIWVS